MKIEQIIYFVKTAQTGSFSLTAEQLYISVPAISVAISDLENELGVKLFHRSRQGVQLTEQGAQLLEDAQKILLDWENLKCKANTAHNSQRGDIFLSVVPSFCFALMPVLLQRMREQFPLLDISVYSGGSNRVLKDIDQGKSQIGMLSFSEDFNFSNTNYVVKPLFYSSFVAITNDAYLKKLPSRHVKLKDLISFPLLSFTGEFDTYLLLNEKIQRLGTQKGITLVEHYGMLQQLCLRGVGIGFMPDFVVWHSLYRQTENLHVIYIDDIEERRMAACIYLKNTPLSKPLRIFLDKCMEFSEEYKANGCKPPFVE